MRCKKTLSRGKPGFDFRTDTLSQRRVTCIRSRIRFFTNFFRMKSIVSLKTDFLRRNRSKEETRMRKCANRKKETALRYRIQTGIE